MGYKTLKEAEKENLVKKASKEAILKGFGDLARLVGEPKALKKEEIINTEPVYTKTRQSSNLSEEKNENGNIPVRNALNNMGLDDSKIGWSDGYVTYEGVRMKPREVQNGVSYATREDITAFADNIYKAGGLTPTRVTDYVAPGGIGAVSYSPERGVMVGGKTIPTLYTYDGRAVTDEKVLDEAYKNLRQNLGIKSAEELYEDFEKSYGDKIEKAYKKIEDYPKWTYDPYSDPAYKAYRDAYTREGERAFRDAAAKIVTKNNGNMTSAAQTVANQQLAYYLDMLNDRVPELMKLSYDRYKSDYDKKLDELNLYREDAEAGWKKMQYINELAKSDYYKQREEENLRNDSAREEKLYDEELKTIQNENYEKLYSLAQNRGYFTEEEAKALNIPKKANGEYYTPMEIKIENEVKYFNEVVVPKMSYESLMKIRQIASEYAQKKALEEAKFEQEKIKMGMDEY